MGARRNVAGTLRIALVASFTLAVPVLVLLVSGVELMGSWPWAIIPFSSAAVLLVWESIRWQQQAVLLKHPVRYWGLRWLGGLLVAAIAIASIIKTETGWGWTWRGRSLALPTYAKAKPSA
jgi:hypothetical protein